jgi:multicomponent Na+:H+ antiporter subunit G
MAWLTAGLLLVGAAFTLLAAVGVLRMPDVYTRLSATSKAATLGVACVLLAGALHFREQGLVDRAIAMIVFVFLTAPVAAHMIGRAAWLARVPLWDGTRLNQLEAGEREHPVPEPDGGEAGPAGDSRAGRS